MRDTQEQQVYQTYMTSFLHVFVWCAISDNLISALFSFCLIFSFLGLGYDFKSRPSLNSAQLISLVTTTTRHSALMKKQKHQQAGRLYLTTLA